MCYSLQMKYKSLKLVLCVALLASAQSVKAAEFSYVACETRTVGTSLLSQVKVAVDPAKNEVLFEMISPHQVSARFAIKDKQITRTGFFKRISKVWLKGTVIETFDHYDSTHRVLPNFWDTIEWNISGYPLSGNRNPFFGSVKISGAGGVGATFELWCRRTN